MRLDLVPWIVVVLLSGLLALTGLSYLDLRDEHAAFLAKAEQQARDREEATRKKEAEQRHNLTLIKEDYEKKIVMARRDAVRHYRLRQPLGDGVRPLSLAAPRLQVDDVPTEQRLAADPGPAGIDDGTLGGCAEDALKLMAWQDWAKRNQIPVEEQDE